MNDCKTEMTFTEVDGDGELVYVCFDCGAMEYRVPEGECPGCEDSENAPHWRSCPRWDNPENGAIEDYTLVRGALSLSPSDFE